VDSVCTGTKSPVRIFNTEIGCRYWLGTYNSSYSDTVAGNGGTITLFTSAPFANNNTIEVAAITKYGCINGLNHSDPPNTYHTYVRPVNVDFSVSRQGGWIGESFTIKNNSDLDSYSWNIDGSISTKVTPDTVKFATTGIKTITLIGKAKFPGCIDTATKKIEIVSAPALPTGSSCLFDTLKQSSLNDNIRLLYNGATVLAFHVDKEGNQYVSSYVPLTTGGEYSGGSFGLCLKKFNRNNELVWEKYHDPKNGSGKSYDDPYFYSNYIVDIESDNSGNIYVAGAVSANSWQWDNMKISSTVTPVTNTGYVMKLNSSGIVQWVIKSNPPNTSTITSFTDILYVNDSTICATALSARSMDFPDGMTQGNNYNNIVLIVFNKDGKLIKNYTTGWSQDGSIYAGYDPNYTSYLNKYMFVSPKILRASTGKIILAGKAVGKLYFGNLTYNVKDKDNTFFIARLDLKNGWEKVTNLYSFFAPDFALLRPYANIPLFTIDATDNLYVSDYFGDDYHDIRVTINGTQPIPSFRKGGFTAKFDLDGNLKWYDSTAYMSGKGMMALDKEILVYGDFENFYSVKTSGSNMVGLRSKKLKDAVLTSFSMDGKVNWITAIASDSIVGANWIVKDKCLNNVYFCGAGTRTTSFLNKSLNLKPSRFFIGKYSPDNDCSIKNCRDCAGVLNGTAFLDSCHTCAGGTTGIAPVLDFTLCKKDCMGMIGGTAFIDTCGNCAGGSTGITPVLNVLNCKKDCAGVPRGKAFIDSCKVCAGGTTGITPVLDKALCKRDCAGVMSGTAFLDSCKICAGGTTGIIPILDKSKCKRDCAGVINGKAFIDSCKICAGGTTGIIPILDVKLCKVTGIDKFGRDESELSIYPNPSLGKLFITSTEAISEITISNAIGEVMFSAAILNGSMNYSTDISALPNALYFVVIKTKKSMFYRKIILAKSDY
jgi:hypothetical protein